MDAQAGYSLGQAHVAGIPPSGLRFSDRQQLGSLRQDVQGQVAYLVALAFHTDVRHAFPLVHAAHGQHADTAVVSMASRWAL
jgi:hypothetical protein